MKVYIVTTEIDTCNYGKLYDFQTVFKNEQDAINYCETHNKNKHKFDDSIYVYKIVNVE